MTEPILQAHRGVSTDYPENSKERNIRRACRINIKG